MPLGCFLRREPGEGAQRSWCRAFPSMPVPQTSIGSTSGAGYGDQQQEDPYANAPMTSMGAADELEELLDSLDLAEYLEAFRSKGYDKVEDIARMGLDRLCDRIGMLEGHAERLLHRLAAANHRLAAAN